jgi:hypothetical protein
VIDLVEIKWGSEECRRHHPAMNKFVHGGGGRRIISPLLAVPYPKQAMKIDP